MGMQCKLTEVQRTSLVSHLLSNFNICPVCFLRSIVKDFVKRHVLVKSLSSVLWLKAGNYVMPNTFLVPPNAKPSVNTFKHSRKTEEIAWGDIWMPDIKKGCWNSQGGSQMQNIKIENVVKIWKQEKRCSSEDEMKYAIEACLESAR